MAPRTSAPSRSSIPTIADRLIVGIDEMDGAYVRGALHVVLAANRQHRRPPATYHAAGEHHVEERRDDVGAIGVLCQPHRPQRAGVWPARVHLGGAPDLLGRDTGDLGGLLRPVRLYGFADLLKIMR